VTGFGTVAVRMPALIVAFVNVRVRSRFTAKRDLSSFARSATIERQTGGRMAVRAVLEGTRNARQTLASVTPSVIRVGEQPIRSRMR